MGWSCQLKLVYQLYAILQSPLHDFAMLAISSGYHGQDLMKDFWHKSMLRRSGSLVFLPSLCQFLRLPRYSKCRIEPFCRGADDHAGLCRDPRPQVLSGPHHRHQKTPRDRKPPTLRKGQVIIQPKICVSPSLSFPDVALNIVQKDNKYILYYYLRLSSSTVSGMGKHFWLFSLTVIQNLLTPFCVERGD